MSALQYITPLLGDPFAHFSTTEATEQWLAEVTVDLASYGADHFSAALTAEAKRTAVDGGAVPTLCVRMGGASGAADGTLILTVAPGVSSADWIALMVSTARVNAHGTVLLKLTGKSSIADQEVEFYAASLTLGLTAMTPVAYRDVSGIGEDIWAAQASETGAPEYVVTSSGDWTAVTGREAVQQSLIRRFLTKPGDYRVDPTYGAGLLAAAKKRMRRSDMDDISRRLRQQALADDRVNAVTSLTVESIPGTDNGVKYTITIDLVADGVPLTFSQEIR